MQMEKVEVVSTLYPTGFMGINYLADSGTRAGAAVAAGFGAVVVRSVVVLVACTGGFGAPTADLVTVVVVVVFLMVVAATPLVTGFLAAVLSVDVVFFSIGALTVRTAGFGAAAAVLDASVLAGEVADVRAVDTAGFKVDFNGAAAGFLAAKVVGFLVAAVTFGSFAGEVDLAVATPAAANKSTFGSSCAGATLDSAGTSTGSMG